MIRKLLIAVTAGLILSGIGTSAYALSQGSVDQAIAFAWPVLGIAMIFGMMMPRQQAG